MLKGVPGRLVWKVNISLVRDRTVWLHQHSSPHFARSFHIVSNSHLSISVSKWNIVPTKSLEGTAVTFLEARADFSSSNKFRHKQQPIWHFFNTIWFQMEKMSENSKNYWRKKHAGFMNEGRIGPIRWIKKTENRQICKASVHFRKMANTEWLFIKKPLV